jgi:hypothetical protein
MYPASLFFCVEVATPGPATSTQKIRKARLASQKTNYEWISASCPLTTSSKCAKNHADESKHHIDVL